MVCVVAWTEASLKASHSCLSMYRLLQHDIYSPYPVLHFAHPVHSCSFFIFGGRGLPLYLPYPTNIHGAVALTSRGFTNPPGKSFSSINQQSSASAPYPTPPPKEGMFRWL